MYGTYRRSRARARVLVLQKPETAKGAGENRGVGPTGERRDAERHRRREPREACVRNTRSRVENGPTVVRRSLGEAFVTEVLRARPVCTLSAEVLQDA